MPLRFYSYNSNSSNADDNIRTLNNTGLVVVLGTNMDLFLRVTQRTVDLYFETSCFISSSTLCRFGPSTFRYVCFECCILVVCVLENVVFIAECACECDRCVHSVFRF